MPTKTSRPRSADPITEPVADAWARALAVDFTPDALHPLERTAAMHVAAEAQAGRTVSLTAASAHLAKAWRADRLTRRWVRLKPGHRGEYAYRPAGM